MSNPYASEENFNDLGGVRKLEEKAMRKNGRKREEIPAQEFLNSIRVKT
jgi:hypothetical protein